MTAVLIVALVLAVAFAGGGGLALIDRARGRDVPCVCSHTLTAHEHYRAGLDCGLCACPGFLPVFKVRPDVALARSREVPSQPCVDPDPLYDQALPDEQWQRWERQVST